MRLCLFASIAMLAASPLLVAACGGGAGDSSGAKAPEPAPSAAAPSEPVTSSTTTLTLADGGDLIGSKLETKTTTVIPAASTAPTKAAADPTPGPHKSEPGRSVDDVRAIIGARRDEFRACYDKGLSTHPGIQGDVDVKWVINPKGDVTDVSIDEMKSSISEPTTRACITDIIKKIKFAESPKGFESRMHYPFNFNPRSGGKTK